ncbi:tyrosine-protein phosphatase non-receptor type substrate 1-like [Erpetoichthys calabaricus]|uniref:tyrosine-protein phosphatase non-receptor type substrate 1-like n=1 Tax=Erpetoichthys calabaricus TaxID=27687 RepID=UPI0022349D60|nr:tyrosine-protein phosphatase non-receptor type substrate 1-like [Erpetoichthys calabaricus]
MHHLHFWIYFIGIGTGAVFQIIQSPTFLQLYVGDTAVIHCSLLGCAPRRYFWNKTTECENRTDDLFNTSRISISVSGTVRVENVTGSDSGVYYCRVIHKCLKQSPGPVRGNGTRLMVMETPSLHLQLNFSSNNPEDLILTCSAVGFYSSDFTLSWHHSLPEVLHPTQQDARSVLQVGTYSRSSTMLVTKTLWAPGTEIGCEANHTSLTRPLKKYIRSPLEKADSSLEYAYLFALLALPIILGCIYFIVNFFKTKAESDAAKSRDKGNKEEEEKELQYSTLVHKNLKKCSFSKNENELKCIYTQAKPKGDSMAEYEDCVDYAVLDMHENPAAATVDTPVCSQYSSLASIL